MGSDTLIDAIRRAVEASPRDHLLRVHLAELLLAAGRRDEAAAHLDVALLQEPANEAARRLRERVEASSAPAAEPAAPDNVVRLFAIEGGRSDDTGVEDVTDVRLSDVGGMEAVKRRLQMTFLAPLNNPELRRHYGKSMRGGLLLYGPPGCGKTFIARAVAGELGGRFLSIGLTDVLDMWLGSSEQRLAELFEAARRKAPSVVFIDEIDALGQKRSQLRHSAMRTVVNALLCEMDGTAGRNEGVFVLAATNHLWDVDPAFRRPGRLDKTLFVSPPDRAARRAILASSLTDRPTSGVDPDRIAAQTQGYTGADLVRLCEEAVEHALGRALDTGAPGPVTAQDFAEALRSVKPSATAWIETARRYATWSNASGDYDELAEFLKRRPD